MKKVFLNIYLLIPLVFGMYAVLAFIVGWQVFGTRHPFLPAVAGALIFSAGLAMGYFMTRFVLKPAETFVEKIKDSPAVRADDQDDADGPPADELDRFSKLFDRAAQALSTLDAQTLFPDITGTSRAMRQVFSQILKVAKTDATVLICGESGTGKELVAKSIVAHSPRKDKPFITLNCAAVSPNLMESALFGHERGSFTGAVDRKRGCFEQADTGTLFLDEIGDMPLELQVKLLRVLQEPVFMRVGGDKPITVDVRIIAATNKDLRSLIQDGHFREDLFYRINVFPIYLPPLRDRTGDVETLATHFLFRTAPGKQFEPATLDFLKTHSWPGNVRELENMVERAGVLADTEKVVGVRHFPDHLKTAGDKVHAFSETVYKNNRMSLDETLMAFEKELICEALKNTNGVQVQAAEILGIRQRSMWNRVKKYGIDVAAFRPETMA